MDDFSAKIFIYLVIVFSAVFHEYAHSRMALELGDDTAKRHGRLSLNPLVHLDLLGTVLVPLFLLFTSGIFIGWAKPVPYNPYALKDQRYGSLKVAIAGPMANFFIAVSLGLLLRLMAEPLFAVSKVFLELLGFVVYINIFLALFNLIPVPPLDGSKILADLWPARAHSFYSGFAVSGLIGIFLTLLLAIMFLPIIARFIFTIITGGIT